MVIANLLPLYLVCGIQVACGRWQLMRVRGDPWCGMLMFPPKNWDDDPGSTLIPIDVYSCCCCFFGGCVDVLPTTERIA